MKIEIRQEDFATICICAIRYCHGRKTYMPSLVMEIVGRHLSELSDRDIKVMYDDCRFMNLSDYGDEVIDKPNWLLWEKKLKEEVGRRQVTFQDLSKPFNEVLREHHKVCDDCDGFIYDYCSECPIRNKNKDDDAS